MGTAINCATDVFGVILWRPRCGIDRLRASGAIALRTIQTSPNVRSRTGHLQRPTMADGILDGHANMLVWVACHVASIAQAILIITRSRRGIQTSFVFPGTATLDLGTSSVQAYSSGPNRSWLLKHWSQVSVWPVYVHMRPMMASIVLLAM